MNEKLRTLLLDLVTLAGAWSVFYWIRIRSGLITTTVVPDFWMPMVVLCVYWVVLFYFFGLYRSWYAQSRFDELTGIVRAGTFGVLILFFAIVVDDQWGGSPVHSRLLILGYWSLTILFVGGGRLFQHTLQKRLLLAGVGLRSAVIVGWSQKAFTLMESLRQYPALGYKVIGFVPATPAVDATEYRGVPVLGPAERLTDVIDRHGIKDILIALDTTEHDKLLSIIASCNGHDVSLKIIPDLYDIISGQARTNQIYGFPLIEITPQLMQPWERAMKRIVDIVVSATILLIGMPLWILVAIAIKLDSRGPVLYHQRRVGKDEKQFNVLKFRSMHQDAEKRSGPVWANKSDPRVTRVGRIIRKLRLDEVPQLINVLDGDMSLVGPRPERPFFVEQLSKEIPLYKRRLKVRPGITGWAQVKHKYDESIDDVRKKVEYDLYYIENISWRMDLKILLHTIVVVLSGKGH